MLALFLACGRAPAPPPPPADTRDAVLIVVDTLRRDHLSAYGYARPTSPRLDAFAAGAVRYDGAISAAPWTLPSVTALLTGALPSSLGVTRHDSTVPDDALLISEVLSAAGWATGAVSSHSFFSPEHNLQQGFATFDTDNIVGHRAETSAGVTDAAIRFLDAHRSEPVFLVVHYFDPHFAYLRHDDFPFDGPAYDGPVQPGTPIKELRALAARIQPADTDALGRLYDSEVAHTDHHIGRLLDAIAERGRAERSLVAVTHDHGEEFFEHGFIGHTSALYGALINAPLLVRYPTGVGPALGSTEAARVSLMDLPATIAAVLGVDAPLSGPSLLHPSDDRVVRSETQKGADLRAVVGARHKLIWDRREDQWMLFDVLADPLDTTDLIASAPEAAAALRPHARRWGSARPAAGTSLSPASLERLRALGYLVDEE